MKTQKVSNALLMLLSFVLGVTLAASFIVARAQTIYDDDSSDVTSTAADETNGTDADDSTDTSVDDSDTTSDDTDTTDSDEATGTATDTETDAQDDLIEDIDADIDDISSILSQVGTESSLNYPSSGATPAPMVIDADSLGNVLLRGTVSSVELDTLTIDSWGGTWTVRTNGLTNVIPSAGSGIPGDVSAISVGNFIGIDGTIAPDQEFTIDATLIRDWTAQPFTEGTPAVEGAATETETSEPATPDTGSDASGATGTDDTTMTDTATDTTEDTSTNTGTLFGDDADDQTGTATDNTTGDTTTDTGDGITYSGPVDSVNAENNTFTFTDDFNSTYTVTVSGDTTIVNNDEEIIGLDEISEGDEIEVEGSVMGNQIDATTVRNLDATSGFFF